MRSFYAEAFIDERPIYKATVQATSFPAAIGKAAREAKKTGLVRRNASKLVIRLQKIATPKANEPDPV